MTKSSIDYFPETYKSIYDTPAYIWDEFHNGEDINILLELIINQNERDAKYLEHFKMGELLNTLQDEYVSKFPPKEHIKTLQLKLKIAKYRFHAEAFNKRALRTKAALLEEQLPKNTEKKKSVFYDNCFKMEQMKMKVDARTISIFEYNKKLEFILNNNGSK